MQCKACGSKWESATEVSKCPFCGHSLKIEKNPAEIGIADVIRHIIETHGNGILKNSKVVTSYVMDLVQGQERDKKLFRVLCNYDILGGAYKIISTSDPFQQDIIIKRQYKILTDEAFLSGENAAEALNLVLRGIGVREFRTEIHSSSSVITSSATTKKTTESTSSTLPAKPKSSTTQQKTSSKRASGRIDTFYKYQKALEDIYIKNGKQPLTETQIRTFITSNSLDRDWHISADDVRKDLIDIYAKYTQVKSSAAPIVSSQVKTLPTSGLQYTPGKTLATYEAYMSELEKAFIRNGKVKLSSAQISDFILVYNLKRRNITSQEVETDLKEIMRKY